MARGSVFRTNRSQAIRIPKEMALPDSVEKVEIVKLGNSRLIIPVGESWDDWFRGETVSDDFLQDRDQPPAQKREGL